MKKKDSWFLGEHGQIDVRKYEKDDDFVPVLKGCFWGAVFGMIFWALIILCVIGIRSAHAQEIDLQAIASIESGGNPQAVNVRTQCYGLHQISGVCLREYNAAHGTSWTISDMLDGAKNTAVANWYFEERIPAMLKAYKIPCTTLHRIAAYNWGIGHVKKWHRDGAEFNALPKETQRYYKKYVRITGGA